MPEKYEPGFIRELDGRTSLGQRLAKAYDEIVNDTDENLSHTKQALIERFVFLEFTLQNWELEIVAHPDRADKLMGKWIQAINSLTGLAKLIGLRRQPKYVGNLKTYVEKSAK